MVALTEYSGAFGYHLASTGRQLRADFQSEVLVLRAAGQFVQGLGDGTGTTQGTRRATRDIDLQTRQMGRPCWARVRRSPRSVAVTGSFCTARYPIRAVTPFEDQPDTV